MLDFSVSSSEDSFFLKSASGLTSSMISSIETFSYDDLIVKKFSVATIVWGAVALLLGVVIAFQLALYKLNLGLPWTTFGRLRPLHTNAAIFAFAGNAIFAGIYHSSQRLLKTRMFSDFLSKIHFNIMFINKLYFFWIFIFPRPGIYT
jgi:cytochrome c oxidase cbb3-type subunit I/II